MTKKLLILTGIILILILSGCSSQQTETEPLETTNKITEKP